MRRRKTYKVWFHLGAGPNFMKWRIENTYTGEVTFHDREKVTIEMNNCRLVNQESAAKKIHGGDNKTVCAWIACESVSVKDADTYFGYEQLSYNPRTSPYWRDESGFNIDNDSFSVLVTEENRVYLKEKL